MQVLSGIMCDTNMLWNERMRLSYCEGGRRAQMNWPTQELKHTLLVFMCMPLALNYALLPRQYCDHASAVNQDVRA